MPGQRYAKHLLDRVADIQGDGSTRHRASTAAPRWQPIGDERINESWEIVLARRSPIHGEGAKSDQDWHTTQDAARPTDSTAMGLSSPAYKPVAAIRRGVGRRRRGGRVMLGLERSQWALRVTRPVMPASSPAGRLRETCPQMAAWVRLSAPSFRHKL